MKKGELVVSILLVLSIMVILSLFFHFFPLLPSFYFIGMTLSLNLVLNAILSSFGGTFVTWRFLLRREYTKSRRSEVLLAILISILFMLYSLAYDYYNYSEIMTNLPLQIIAQVTLGTFAISLVGLLIGFLAVGTKLRSVPPPIIPTKEPEQKFSATKAGSLLIVFLSIGAVAGYFVGYIVWLYLGRYRLQWVYLYPTQQCFLHHGST